MKGPIQQDRPFVHANKYHREELVPPLRRHVFTHNLRSIVPFGMTIQHQAVGPLIVARGDCIVNEAIRRGGIAVWTVDRRIARGTFAGRAVVAVAKQQRLGGAVD